jgi:CHASE2 domain-containing sensor protein
MTHASSTRAGFVVFFTILAISAGTMLWLLWRFPLMTALITLGVFIVLGVLARLARSIDVDMTDMDRTKQII